MIIYPAIDLRKGKCVRLKQGDFNQTTVYNEDPQEMAKTFKQAGAKWLHVVDLDGAKNCAVTQIDLIARVAKAFDGNMQVGGGVRTTHDIEKLLSAGASRIIVGSICVASPKTVAAWIEQFGPEKLVLALDFRITDNEPHLTEAGWQKDSHKTLWDIIEKIPAAKHILCTDISLDGMEQGPNFDCYQRIVERHPEIHLQASGGIHNTDDIKQLRQIGATGSIIGKALYEGHLNLQEALAC
jgi:phosphoribosylformimino-5-aminoimidazole carboxamide ribotide isomerase